MTIDASIRLQNNFLRFHMWNMRCSWLQCVNSILNVLLLQMALEVMVDEETTSFQLLSVVESGEQVYP